MKTAGNGGLGFESRIRLTNLKKDVNELKNELRIASTSGTNSMETMSNNISKAIRAMADKAKSDISNTEKNISSLSRQIIQQASLIKEIELDVNRRKEAYHKASGMAKLPAFNEWQASKRALQEEKASLAGLNSERSKAKVNLSDLKREYRDYNDALKKSNSLKGEMLGLMTKIGEVYALKRVGQEIIDVRGEMQMLIISFTTLLKSKEASEKLMSELTHSVLTTPLQLTELAQGAEQLLAFGFQANQVNDTLLRLGNISKGLNIPLSEMVYLYGTTMTEGRLFARDMRQFTTRGIPLAEELAKQFGVTKEKVSSLVSAGKVGFPQVEKALISLTSEGGRFYNLMQDQVKSIPGQISNLKDSLTMQFNGLGKSMEGAIGGGIAAARVVVDNLDVLGKTVVSLVATYGIYRTAVLLASAAQSAYGLKTLALRNYILLAQKAQAFLNATMLANPYVAIATVISTLIGVVWAFSDSTTAADRAQKNYNETLEKTKAAKEEMTSEVQKLISIIRSETTSVYEQVKAYDELIKRYSFFAKYSMDDLKKMKEKDLSALLSSFGQKSDKESAAGNLEAKIKELSLLEKKLEELVAEQANNPTSQKGSKILWLQEQIKVAKNEVELLKKDIDNINKIENDASIASMPENDRKKYFEDRISQLKKSKEELSSVGGPISDIILTSINNEINVLEGKLDDLRKKQIVKNKEYWEKQKKDAEEVLDNIDRETFQKLEKGITTGINPETVTLYKEKASIRDKATELLANSTKIAKQEKAAIKAQDKLGERVIASQLALQKAKVDIITEGREKELAQIRLTTSQKIAEIDKEERELQKAYKEAKKSMSPSEKKSFDERRGYAIIEGENSENKVNAKYLEQVREREKEVTSIFVNQEDKKRKAIKDRYDAERKWADEMYGAGNMSMDEYLSFTNLVDSAETQEVLNDLKEKYKTVAEQITEIERQAATDRAKANTDARKAMIDEWEKTQKSRVVTQGMMKDGSFNTLMGNLDRVGTKGISSALTKAKSQLKSAVSSGDLTPTDIKTLIDAVEKGEAVIRERNPFKALTNSIKEYKKQPKGEKDITNIAKSAAAGFSLLEGSLGSVVDGLKQMGLAGDEETQALLGSFTQLAGSASQLAEGIASKNPVAIMQGAIGVITSLFDIFDRKSRKANREIKKQAEIIKDLQAQYKKLEEAIKKAFSTDYYKKQIDQARNLEAQIKSLYKMIEAEQSKRKRKRDEGKIEEWKKEIEDLRSQAADIRRAVIDELMTTDLRSFSSQLASSVIQGYVEGMEDMPSVVQDSMDELMRNMIAKQYDVLIGQKLLKPLFDEMEKSINVDNGDFTFSQYELTKIKAAGQAAKDSLLTAGEGYKKMLEELGLIDLSEKERQGAKKGIATASQESIDVVEGVITNMQSHTYSISQDTKSIMMFVNAIVTHVMNIDKNTGRLENIENDMRSMKEEVQEINLKGVKLR